ncbi:hypothetical protein BV25DRAFT_1774169, partial [Artomyces pyxidatus]
TPKSIVAYLEKDWVPVCSMWSAVHQKGRTIFEGDTNMLLEVYHHQLKSNFVNRKCDHRIDQLAYTLHNEVEPYFRDRYERQMVGLEGPNLK